QIKTCVFIMLKPEPIIKTSSQTKINLFGSIKLHKQVHWRRPKLVVLFRGQQTKVTKHELCPGETSSTPRLSEQHLAEQLTRLHHANGDPTHESGSKEGKKRKESVSWYLDKT